MNVYRIVQGSGDSNVRGIGDSCFVIYINRTIYGGINRNFWGISSCDRIINTNVSKGNSTGGGIGDRCSVGYVDLVGSGFQHCDRWIISDGQLIMR